MLDNKKKKKKIGKIESLKTNSYPSLFISSQVPSLDVQFHRYFHAEQIMEITGKKKMFSF